MQLHCNLLQNELILLEEGGNVGRKGEGGLGGVRNERGSHLEKLELE